MLRFSFICLLLFFLQKLNFESTQVVGSTSVTTPSEKESFHYPPSPGGKTPSTLPPSTCTTVAAAPSTIGSTVVTTSITTTTASGLTSTTASTTTTPTIGVTTEGAAINTTAVVATTAVAGDTTVATVTTSVKTPANVVITTPASTKSIPAMSDATSITSVDGNVVQSPAVRSKKFTVTPVNESKLPQLITTEEVCTDKNVEEQSRSRATSTSRQICQDQLQISDLSEAKTVASQPDDKTTVLTADANQVDSTIVGQKESAPAMTNEQQPITTQQSQQPPLQAVQQTQSQQGGGTQPQRAPGMKSECSVESLPSGYTSQEGTVTRAKQKGQEHMDFENLKQKLDQLSGKQKPSAEAKPQGSLPTTPCNQIGVDPGQIPPGSIAVSMHTQQTIPSQPKHSKEAQAAPVQPVVPTGLPVQSNVSQQQQQHQQIPATMGQVPVQHPNQLVHIAGQQVPGMNQQIVPQPVYQTTPLQQHVVQQQQNQQQQQLINSHIQNQPQVQHQNQALNYNTWHGGQNPLFQQPMSQTVQYLQQQHQLQQQQQHLQHIQNLLHQQQLIQQQLAAAGIYVPVNQLSLPLSDTQPVFNPRRQLEFGLDPQQSLQNAGSYPALVTATMFSPPTNPLTSGAVRPAGVVPGMPPAVPDNYGMHPRVKRVERPADIHNLEQALIEKLHSHKRTTHAGLHHTGHEAMSVLSTPSTPGHLMQAASAHADPVHQMVPHLGVNQELISTIPQHSQEYPKVTSTTDNVLQTTAVDPKEESEQTNITADRNVAPTDEKSSIVEVTRDVAEPDNNGPAAEAVTPQKEQAGESSTSKEETKSAKSRFSVTIVQDDPLKTSTKVSSEVNREKLSSVTSSKADSSEKDQEVPAKVTKRQVSKRGRFQVTTVKDPIGDAVKQDQTVSKTETNQVTKNNSSESVKSELKDSLVPTAVSDKVSSATSGSDYQATIDSIPTSGENSAENTAGSDITPALTKVVSTLAQQINKDSSITKAREMKPSADAKIMSTVGPSTNVAMARDVHNSSMAVSTTPMAGLGAVQPHQSVNLPLVAHMVADALPQTPSLTSQHLSSHQHLMPQSSLTSSSSSVGISGTTLPQNLPHYQQTAVAGMPLAPSTAAVTTAPNTANVSMHSWRKSSLPVVLEISASDHNHVDVDEEISSHTLVASHICSNYHHLRHNSLPCLMHAENKLNSNRSNSYTGVLNPHAINNSNLSSSRSHHSALNATHREHRRQSAPAVNKVHVHSAQLQGGEYAVHDAGLSSSVHAEGSGSGPTAHHIGSSFPNVYASQPGSYVSLEVSFICLFSCLKFAA